VLLLAIDVHELLEPNGRGRYGVEETKGASGRSRRCIAELDLVELGWEGFIVMKVGLATIVLFNSVGYSLVTLKAGLGEAMLVLKMFCVTLKDMVPPVGSLDSVIRRLASSILSSVSCYSEGGRRSLPFLDHRLPLGNGHCSAANWDGELLWDFLCISRSCLEWHCGPTCCGEGRKERA
jgi:hypothetical protein